MAKLPERIEEELDRATDARSDAQLLIEQGGSLSGAVNRLYYATFHAAQAVLYAYGKNPTSHGEVRQQFGQYVVLAGGATREEGRLLGKLYDYRLEADYGPVLRRLIYKRLSEQSNHLSTG